jgi:hypothetical protein
MRWRCERSSIIIQFGTVPKVWLTLLRHSESVINPNMGFSLIFFFDEHNYF